MRIRSPLFIAALCLCSSLSAQVVVDFEDLSLAPESVVHGDPSQDPFISNSVSFNRTWLTSYDCCPGAWAYSNQTDLETAGAANPFSAFALPEGGGAHGSDNFGIANNFFLGDAVVTLPIATNVEGMYVTNTTFAYLAVAEGNDGQEPGQPPLFVKGPFTDDDWFKLEIVGQDSTGTETGRVDFYLADFRNGASTIIDDWTWINLQGLGDGVKSLAFELSSTDEGMFGMNTPAYFAMDNLTIVIPEGDFDGDLAFTCDDVDELVSAVAKGSADARYDLDQNESVDEADVAAWLSIAGTANEGAAYLPGDANLDGTVDGADFLVWNDHKFSATAAWCSGDFNADGATDGTDFLIWNDHKFQSSEARAVPEPTAVLTLLVMAAASLRLGSIPNSGTLASLRSEIP